VHAQVLVDVRAAKDDPLQSGTVNKVGSICCFGDLKARTSASMGCSTSAITSTSTVLLHTHKRLHSSHPNSHHIKILYLHVHGLQHSRISPSLHCRPPSPQVRAACSCSCLLLHPCSLNFAFVLCSGPGTPALGAGTVLCVNIMLYRGLCVGLHCLCAVRWPWDPCSWHRHGHVCEHIMVCWFERESALPHAPATNRDSLILMPARSCV